MLKQLAIVAALCCSVAHGQSPNALPTAFPEGAQPPTAAQLSELLGGQVLTAKLFNGETWRMEYNASGNVFVNTSTGANLGGKWRTEDGRVCTELRSKYGFSSDCNEFRTSGDALYLKRSSTGEVVALQKQ